MLYHSKDDQTSYYILPPFSSSILAKSASCFFLSAFLFFSSSLVYAVDLPPSEQAGVVEKKVRREISEAPEHKEKVSKPEEEIEGKPLSEGQFFVRTIRLQGNTQIQSKELEPLLHSYENQKQTTSSLKKLTKAINWEYRQRGFITSFAFVAPQKIEDQTLVIQIVEGKVGEVLVEGNRYFRKRRILSYSKLKKGEILHYDDLRQTLDRLNRNPDRRVRSILKSGREPQTTDVLLNVQDHLPIHFGSSYDNQGSESSGEQRFGLSLRDNNLLGLDDDLSTGTVFGKHFGVLFTQYSVPLPSWDTKLVGGFSHSQVSPKKDLKDFGVNGTSETYFTRLEQRVLEGNAGFLAYSLGCQAGFEFKEDRTKVLSGTFRRERLRILRFGPTLTLEDPWGVTEIGNEFSFGINAFGAGIHADESSSRQGVEPNFFVMQATLFRTQKMPADTHASLKTHFQLPTEKLSSSEELYLGGANTVRGYPEGDYLGDAGYLINLEYFIPTFFLPGEWKLPYSNIPIQKQVEIVTFLDEAYGHLRGPSSREVESRHLAGVGAGLRIKLYRNLYGRVEWGFAVGAHPLTESNRHEFHFRVQFEV